MAFQPSTYFSSLKIDNEGADYDNHSCNGTECRILSREHDPAKYGAQYRVDQSAHIDITHFGSFTLQGDKPEAESKDLDKYQNRKTDIESGRFSDK